MRRIFPCWGWRERRRQRQNEHEIIDCNSKILNLQLCLQTIESGIQAGGWRNGDKNNLSEFVRLKHKQLEARQALDDANILLDHLRESGNVDPVADFRHFDANISRRHPIKHANPNELRVKGEAKAKEATLRAEEHDALLAGENLVAETVESEFENLLAQDKEELRQHERVIVNPRGYDGPPISVKAEEIQPIHVV